MGEGGGAASRRDGATLPCVGGEEPGGSWRQMGTGDGGAAAAGKGWSELGATDDGLGTDGRTDTEGSPGDDDVVRSGGRG